GGGGGALVIRARGPIVFGPNGLVLASGGAGARRGAQGDPGGACGGSGSGGHVILESTQAIDFTEGSPAAAVRTHVLAVGGPRIVQSSSQEGSGGRGGPGVVQLHVPHPERAPGTPGSNLILPPG